VSKTTMLDLDGVVHPWVPTFQPWLESRIGKKIGQWLTWHHYRHHGITDAEFVAHLNQYAEEGGFTWSDPYHGSVDPLHRLIEHGHTIHIVTDRPVVAHAGTIDWLDRHNVPYHSLVIGRDKTVFMEQGEGPYFAIDDRIENVQAMRDAGIHAYLLDRPWNEDSDLPRVSTMEEYVEIVLNY